MVLRGFDLTWVYPVNSFTRVASNPSEGHLQQLYDYLSYIRSTIDEEPKFFKDSSVYIGMDFVFGVWSDSSFADDDTTMRSTTDGWYIFWDLFKALYLPIHIYDDLSQYPLLNPNTARTVMEQTMQCMYSNF